MSPDQIKIAVVALFPQYCNVVCYLEKKMLLPKYVLMDPSTDVLLLIDGNVRGFFHVENTQLTVNPIIDDLHGWETDVSAGYSDNPNNIHRGLVFNSEKLTEDAKGAGVQEAALLRILTLHEFVHIAMMEWWYEKCPWHGWVKDYDNRYRYVHETFALAFCRFGLLEILDTNDHACIAKYLNYVQRRSTDGDGVDFYGPYFDRYQNINPNQIWERVSGELGDKFIAELENLVK